MCSLIQYYVLRAPQEFARYHLIYFSPIDKPTVATPDHASRICELSSGSYNLSLGSVCGARVWESIFRKVHKEPWRTVSLLKQKLIFIPQFQFESGF